MDGRALVYMCVCGGQTDTRREYIVWAPGGGGDGDGGGSIGRDNHSSTTNLTDLATAITLCTKAEEEQEQEC